MDIVKNLPIDLRLHILSFADMDTKRHAGLPPNKLPATTKLQLAQLINTSREKTHAMGATIALKLSRENPDEPYLHRYEIYQHIDEEYEIKKIRGKLATRQNRPTLVICEYENYVYDIHMQTYTCKLRISCAT